MRALLVGLAACGGTAAHASVANHDPHPPPEHRLALAIVFNDQETFVGTDQVLPLDDPFRYLGILQPLELAIDAAHLDHGVGLAVGYDDDAHLRVPPRRLSSFTGAALGAEKDYYGKHGTAMVYGLELAEAELAKVSAVTKLIVVIGDGNDTDNEHARRQLDHLRIRLGIEHVRVRAIVFKGALSDATDIIEHLDPHPRRVSATAELAAAFAAALER